MRPRTAPTDPTTADRAAGEAPWRARRRRAVYDRAARRSVERWPVPTRVLHGLLSRPEPLLRLLGDPAPVVVDGRVLNRGTQVLLAAVARRGSAADPFAGSAVDARREFDRTAAFLMPVRTDVHVVGRLVPGTGGAPDVPVRVYRQFGTGLGAGPRPAAIVFFHGGGWVIGNLDSHDGVCRMLAAVTGCVVVAVDYRLAPEHPYPAPLDDCLAAYDWVQGHPGELGTEPGRVAVMGDSAGGNLAAVVCLERRSGHGGAPPPVAQGLVYPATDARAGSRSMETLGEGFLLTRAAMEFFGRAYLPDDVDRLQATVSPLLADDHGGLPPALVVTAGFDPLRDEGAAYAAALRSAGVEVEERCYDDQIHGFVGMGILPDSLAATIEVCDAMGRLVRRSGPDA